MKPENKLEAEITSSFQIKTASLLSQRGTILKSPAFFCQQREGGEGTEAKASLPFFIFY